MKFGYTINNKLMINSNGKLIGTDPYNPLNLPQGTIRVRTNDGQPPINGSYTRATLVEGTTDVYDVYNISPDLCGLLFYNSTNVVEVLCADTSEMVHSYGMFRNCTALSSVQLFDTSKVTNMAGMFADCTSLTSAPLFDTKNANNMESMFLRCSSITSVPLYDTSNLIDMSYAFDNCVNVQSGALALYQQASTQAHTPGHICTFTNCGINTETGSAELAQIHSDWK